MFSGIGRSYYNINEIISNVSQEQLFLKYIGILPNTQGKFLSPFRQDKNPGCRFKWHSGFLYLVENSMYKGKLYWNIFDCIQEKYGVDFNKSLEMVANEIITESKTVLAPKSFLPKKRPTISFTYNDWKSDNLFFLDNDTLISENTFLVKDYWINNRKNPIHNPQRTLTIAYYFPKSNHVKLYFPESEEMRWYSNCDTNDIFGLNKLEYYKNNYDYIVITKSQKDRLILDYKFNIPCISLQNEGSHIPDNIVKELNESFEEIYILFDNDYTGRNLSLKFSEKYNFKILNIPQDYKDSYEFYTKVKNV